MNKIQEVLTKRFESHRIIFWYDENKTLSEQFEEIDILGVAKIHVEGNEFEVKYIVSKQKPETKFLLYFTGEKPVYEDNWLLDLELAHHVFHTDKEALHLQEIGLGYHLKELVTEHLLFFEAKDRRNKLKKLLGDNDKHEDIRGKMLAVVFNTEHVNLNTFIHAHANAYMDGNERLDKDLDRYNLSSYYWGKIKHQFNYSSDTPSIYDFLLEVFGANFVLGNASNLSKESRLLLSLWKDTIQYRESFGVLSEQIAQDLEVESKLNEASIDSIIGDDLFKVVDQKIIHDLVTLLVDESLSFDKLIQHSKLRENKFWYTHFENIYKTLEKGALLIHLVRKLSSVSYESFSEGVADYAGKRYEIDYAYRKFIYHYRQSNHVSILSQLYEKVEKVYSNDWLLPYNNNWQSVMDNMELPHLDSKSQQRFFAYHVKPFTVKKNRLYVIISDAFRYECGVELSKRLQAENRYESSIDYMSASLPSYTQLGMASLLPHKELSFHEGSDNIDVDGMSSAGISGRAKILNANSGVRAVAINAEELMKMNSSTAGRNFNKQYDLIYIYHNRIDKVGDDKMSEEKVFDAAEEEISYLMSMIKKISNMNGNNMIITTDHGFIYQHAALDESDFSVSQHDGEIWKNNRRFVIGKDLTNDDATSLFKASELNIKSDVNILLPKSINRLRVKGAGSRFIHGGASLQEMVIPLVKVTKKRLDTTSQVEIDIIQSTNKITTNIISVSFIQQGLVIEQVLSRSLRATFYAQDGERLSDQFSYNFDIVEGSERQREIKHRFQLLGKASGKYNNQEVRLVLEEPVEGTTKWREYKKFSYSLNISFTNDFDDF